MDDYKVINTIFEELYPLNADFSCRDVIEYLDNHQGTLKQVNRTVINYDG